MTDPVQYLRTQTYPQHKALEAQPHFARIMNPQVSLNDYKALLTLLYQFHAQAEPALNDALKNKPSSNILRPRLELLASDLKSQDLPIPCTASFKLDLNDEASALGAVYVIEGSALGGQIIARHLQSTLQEKVSRSLTFYNTLGRDIGPHWQKVIRQLRGHLTTEQTRKSAVEGACAVFDRLLELAGKNRAEATSTTTS